MEDIENKSTGTEGTSLLFIEGVAEGAESSEGSLGQREDSGSGTGETGSEAETPEGGEIDSGIVVPEEAPEVEVAPESVFPVALTNPGGDVFKFYGDIVTNFQREIIALKDPAFNSLTITHMTTPSIDAPGIFITPYCGFAVEKADNFSIRLNNGLLITA